MKKLLVIALAASISTAANAQQTATQATTPAAGTSATPAVQAEAPKSKFGASIASQNTIGAKDANDFGKDAGLVSADTLALSYKVSDKIKAIAYHNFLYLGHLANNTDGATLSAKGYKEGYNLMDPAIGLSTQLAGIRGSDPINFGARYYAPVIDASINAKKLGMLRADAEINWTLNPKWSVSYVASPRFAAYQDKESMLRLIHSAGLSYNTSDASGIYATAGFDTTWSKLSNAETVAETLELELGGSVMLGKFAINPAITNSIGTKSGQMALARTEETAYNLTVSAGF